MRHAEVVPFLERFAAGSSTDEEVVIARTVMRRLLAGETFRAVVGLRGVALQRRHQVSERNRLVCRVFEMLFSDRSSVSAAATAISRELHDLDGRVDPRRIEQEIASDAESVRGLLLQILKLCPRGRTGDLRGVRSKQLARVLRDIGGPSNVPPQQVASESRNAQESQHECAAIESGRRDRRRRAS